jgi:ATP-dependent DNA helicase Rep
MANPMPLSYPPCTPPKGLEFGHVFLIGCEEGLLPHQQSIDNNQIEEERRLMYVGITRAQKSLNISWCKKRKRAGEMQLCEQSRFIGELPSQDVKHFGNPFNDPDQLTSQPRVWQIKNGQHTCDA